MMFCRINGLTGFHSLARKILSLRLLGNICKFRRDRIKWQLEEERERDFGVASFPNAKEGVGHLGLCCSSIERLEAFIEQFLCFSFFF